MFDKTHVVRALTVLNILLLNLLEKYKKVEKGDMVSVGS